MFSFIVCSINAAYLEGLKQNLAATCGVPYELLVWDNNADTKPITEVYNILGDRATHDFLCFLHEDILFQKDNWGEIVRKGFDDPLIGLVGVAGARYKSRTPSGWSTGFRDWDCMNILHRDKTGHTEHFRVQPTPAAIEKVVNIDGVFLCIRRAVWSEVRFDDRLLRGFHLYDIDFSSRVTEKFQAAVLFELDILHLTEGGNFGDQWVEYTLAWHKSQKPRLPQVVSGAAGGDLSARERKIRRNWLHRLTPENISGRNRWRWVLDTGAFSDPVAWPYILQFLIGRRLRR